MNPVVRALFVIFLVFPGLLNGSSIALPGRGPVPASLRYQGCWIEKPGEKDLGLVCMENAQIDEKLRLGGLISRFGLQVGKDLPFSAVERVRAGWGMLVFDLKSGKFEKPGRGKKTTFLLVQTFWVPPGMNDLSLASKAMETEKRFTLDFSERLKAKRKAGFIFEKEPPRRDGPVKVFGAVVRFNDHGKGSRRNRLFCRWALYCCGDRVVQLSCGKLPGMEDPFVEGGLWDRTVSAFRCVFREKGFDFFRWIQQKDFLGVLLGCLIGAYPLIWFFRRLEEREKEFRAEPSNNADK